MSIYNRSSIMFDGEPIYSNEVMTDIDLALTIVKTVDKTSAMAGNILEYSILISNPNNYEVTDILFVDTYDNVQTTYLANTFSVDGVMATPDSILPTITYNIPSIDALGDVTITFQVTINAD